MFGIANAYVNDNAAADRQSCEAFCRAHWPRLFGLARLGGCDPHDAEDAVQELFERLARRGLISTLARLPVAQQGTHLVTRMKCHLANRWRDRHRLRRGGDCVIVPLTLDDGSVLDVPDERDETAAAERELDIARLVRALATLRDEMKPRAWSRLEPWLLPDRQEQGPFPRQSGAVRVALHRARRRLRELAAAAALIALAFFSSSPAHAHPDHEHFVLAAAPAGANAGVASEVTITVEDDVRVIRSNGLPDHQPGEFPRRGNPNTIAPQQHEFRVTTKPKTRAQPFAARHGWFGIALNGVPFEAGTAELWSEDWRYEAIGGAINLGLDEHLAHVQPSGAYHYHGLPTGLIASRGGDQTRMLLIGWAADGFPIYTSMAHSKAGDAASPLAKMRSSYRLKSGTRPREPRGPGGSYDGAFTADYEYIRGSGDLDECNGRTGFTPEFPEGTYYYCLTAEFPFAPRLWRGTPDPSFEKRGRGPPGMGPPPGGRPPGRRGPPEFDGPPPR